MGASQLLLVGGIILFGIGLALLITRKQRNTAIALLIAGLFLILVPPLFVIFNTM